MGTKSLPVPPKGMRLEDRYGELGLRAVAGAVRPAKAAKAAKAG